MKQLVRTGLAGLVLTAAAVPVATAADLTVRAEGPSGTTVAQVSVPTTGPAVTKNGKTCGGDTAAGALERATGGDWDGTAFSFGLSVDRIRAVSLPFSSGKFWSFDVNHSAAQAGVCDIKPQAGDEVLFYAACAGATEGCFSGTPLDITAPATVVAGQPFTVTVDQYDDSKDPAPKSPAGNATVSGGGASATTTPVSGTASLTLEQRGPVVLTATKGTQVRDEARVCVTDGTDGVCGSPYVIPGGPGPTPTPSTCPPTCAGGPLDTTAPVSRIRGIRDGRRFKRRRGPRTLRATVTEESSLAAVRLSLTRRVRGRCSAFSARKERFRRVRCGRHPSFGVGSSPKVSFLLPARLKKGRYVFGVVGIDRAGNRERLARGRNRIVFKVA